MLLNWENVFVSYIKLKLGIVTKDFFGLKKMHPSDVLFFPWGYVYIKRFQIYTRHQGSVYRVTDLLF